MRKTVLGILVVVGMTGCGGTTDSPIDPNKQYMLAISSASVKANNNGSAWDADSSAPDVFVRFTVAGVSSDSTTVQDSYTPGWNPAQGVVVTAAVLRASGVAPVSVAFWDEDLTVDDTITGTFNVVLTDDDINAGQVTYANVNGLASATFIIVPQ